VGVALAQQLTVNINKISDERIGTVTITQSKKGTNFKVVVNGIPAGKQGFYVHEEGNCAAGTEDGKTVPGLAAGGHCNPEGKKSHKGPQAARHKGDLPVHTATASIRR
jgi:superoxide dismutase, Cu-Zn family